MSQKANLSQLQEKMTIQAYVGLEARFSQLTDEQVRWLAHNFSGAYGIITRKGQKADIPLVKLVPGDKLHRIHKFPTKLKHLCEVTPKLLASLKQRQFTQFEVKKTQHPGHAGKVEKANQLVQSVKKGFQVKHKTSKVIEEIMDSSKKGVPEINQLEGYVGQILEDQLIESMSALSALKRSSQTYAHCVDVGAIFLAAYYEIKRRKGQKPSFTDEKDALISAMLHDVGKGTIPKEILESEVKWEKGSPELQMFQGHPAKSQEMLKQMGMGELAQNMALCHHLKASGLGQNNYPNNVDYELASYEARLLAIVDVYQSLIGKRPYKKSWTAPSAMRYIESLAGIDYDEEVWKDFRLVMGIYPKGSLVKLSTGAAGFVVSVPEDDLERPQVAVSTDANLKPLPKQELLDLKMEPSITIVEDLDPDQVFQGKALERFANLQIQ